MRILIVGSTSAIGMALAARFERFAEVRLAGRQDADILLDLSQWGKLPEPGESFDVVVHTAADFGGGKDDEFIKAELVNAVGTLAVCRLARHVHAKHIVLLSSISATYQLGDPYYGIYSLSKRHSEETAQFFCSERNIALTILRPTQIYDDAGICRRHQALLYFMADRAQAGENISLYGSNDALRNFLHLDDFAEICSRVVRDRRAGVFTCAHPQSIRLSEVADAAFSAFGRGGQVQFMPENPDLADLPATEDYSLYDSIDYWPTISISEGFKRIRNFRESNS